MFVDDPGAGNGFYGQDPALELGIVTEPVLEGRQKAVGEGFEG
jgi:hypothetical protein